MTGIDTSNATGLLELSYDAMNRIKGVSNFYRSGSGAYKRVYRTLLIYDEQGKLTEESFIDEPGDNDNYSGSYSYQYDAMNRLTSINDDNGTPFQSYTYDSQGRINSRTTFVYDGPTIISSSVETFELDAQNNISTNVATIQNSYGSFRRKIVSSYDQVPNPLYNFPFTIWSSGLLAATPNTPMVQTVMETNQLTGAFEPLTSNQTYTITREYKDGLLIKTINPRFDQGTIFEYEKH